MNTYKVSLPTTNSMGNTGRDGDGYIDVEGGLLFVLADDAAAVGRRFPNALSIVRVGLGLSLAPPPAGKEGK